MICGGKFSLAIFPLDLFVSNDSVGIIVADEDEDGAVSDTIVSKIICVGLGVSREDGDDSIFDNVRLSSQWKPD